MADPSTDLAIHDNVDDTKHRSRWGGRSVEKMPTGRTCWHIRIKTDQGGFEWNANTAKLTLTRFPSPWRITKTALAIITIPIPATINRYATAGTVSLHRNDADANLEQQTRNIDLQRWSMMQARPVASDELKVRRWPYTENGGAVADHCVQSTISDVDDTNIRIGGGGDQSGKLCKR